MKVGFLNNQIDNRGTGNALFDYAHYNEEILGNESFLFSLTDINEDKLMADRLWDRFTGYHLVRPDHGIPNFLDVLYHIKSGVDDGFRPPEGVRYAVHAVFDYQPHGDRYAVVSPWMGRVHNAPYVPHIVDLPSTTENLRSRLAIPEDAIVFGRHGGADSFDIPFVWNAIHRALLENPNIWFIFMSTNYVHLHNDRVIFLPQTADPYEKRKFINTCDAMLHARGRGETFGIAVGEFAICGKPIVTYGLSPERSHYVEANCFKYNNEDELYNILVHSNQWLDLYEPYDNYGYMDFTPEKVMKQFKEVFLDD